MQIQKSFTAPASTSYGALFLVGTPVGNLDDMTYRAVKVLREVDMIAAEDTRQTKKLLNHFEIDARLVSYHEHNKEASGVELVRLLKEGKNIALVSDAGMPAISDPGYELVRDAVAAGIHVVPIPGANAALLALIASGLSTERFMYVGFLARQKKTLTAQLAELQLVTSTMICYEAPHRLLKTLEAMLEVWGNRQVVLAKELTKRHESIMRGTIQECIAELMENEPRGEYVLVINGADKYAQAAQAEVWWEQLSIKEHVDHYILEGIDRKEAMRKTAKDRQISRREVYAEWLQ